MDIYIQKFGKLEQRYFEPDEIEYSPHSGDCIKVLNKQNGKEKTYVVINEDVCNLRLHTRELMPRVRYTICDEKHLDNICMFSVSALLDKERWILRIYDSFGIERKRNGIYSFVDTLDQDIAITILIGKYKRKDTFNVKIPCELKN